MRHALFLVLLSLLSYSAHAHKAIEDEETADNIPEELIDSFETTTKELSDAEKAR